MSMQANYFKLGLFVIVSVLLLIAGVIALGAGELFKKKIYIESYFAESVEGLTDGAAVKYRGVKLGTVSTIEMARVKYDPQYFEKGDLRGLVLVELALDQKDTVDLTTEQLVNWFQKAVDAGLRVRMAKSGLTGPAFIELVYVDPQAFPPLALDWTPPPLYIPSIASPMQEIVTAIRTVLNNLKEVDLEKVVADVERLLNDADTKINEIDAKTISDEAVALLHGLQDSNRRLQDILNNPNIDPSLDDLQATLENAKNLTARLQEIIHDPQIQRIIDNVDHATGEIPPALMDVRRAVRRIDRLVASQQSTIEAALEDLRKAMNNIEVITEDAKENPSRILFGDPPPHDTPGGHP